MDTGFETLNLVISPEKRGGHRFVIPSVSDSCSMTDEDYSKKNVFVEEVDTGFKTPLLVIDLA